MVEVLGSAYEHAGHREVLQYVFDEGCPLAADELQPPHAQAFDGSYVTGIRSIAYVAARNGTVASLEMLVERGCVLMTQAHHHLCTVAATGGHLTCLKWLREHGCEWDESTWIAAADHTGGQMLYLDSDDWVSSVSQGYQGRPHLDVLRYMYEEECPVPANEASCLLYQYVSAALVRNPDP